MRTGRWQVRCRDAGVIFIGQVAVQAIVVTTLLPLDGGARAGLAAALYRRAHADASHPLTLSAAVVLGQLCSLVIDLLELSGLTSSDAIARIPAR